MTAPRPDLFSRLARYWIAEPLAATPGGGRTWLALLAAGLGLQLAAPTVVDALTTGGAILVVLWLIARLTGGLR